MAPQLFKNNHPLPGGSEGFIFGLVLIHYSIAYGRFLKGSTAHRSTHTSASFPQVEQVPVPFICDLAWGWSWAAGSGLTASVSCNVQVTTISASLPQFSHLHTCLTVFIDSFIALSGMIPLIWPPTIYTRGLNQLTGQYSIQKTKKMF
jgi:hypothetical protein